MNEESINLSATLIPTDSAGITIANGTPNMEISVSPKVSSDTIITEETWTARIEDSRRVADAIKNQIPKQDPTIDVPVTSESPKPENDTVVESTDTEESPDSIVNQILFKQQKEQKELDSNFEDLFGIENDNDTSEDTTSNDTSEEDTFARAMLSIPTGTSADLQNLKTQFKNTTELRQQLNDPNSYISKSFFAHSYGLRNSFSKFQKDIFITVSGKYANVKPANSTFQNTITDASKVSKRNKDGSVLTLTGTNAQLAMIAYLKGLIRVPLLNSGFYVQLRPLSIMEISEFQNAVHISAREFGHELGSHVILASDYFIKKKFMELLVGYNVIERCNLKDWEKPGVFEAHLSFHDYLPLVAAVLQIQHRTNGVRIDIPCDHCTHVTDRVVVDMATTRFVNYDLLNESALEYWEKIGNGNQVTSKQAIEYRQTILGFNRKFRQKVDPSNKNSNEIKIELVDPTMGEYFSRVDSIVTDINGMIHGVNEASKKPTIIREIISSQTMINLYRMLTPWIGSVTVYNEDGSAAFRTSEMKALNWVMSIDRQEANESIEKELRQFIAESQIVHIGTFNLECPHCHAVPSDDENRFFPIDVQSLFFAHCFLRS